MNISNRLLGRLYTKRVITDEEKIQMNEMNKKERIEYLLDNVIIPSLRSGHSKKYINFIDVMKNSEDTLLQSRASKMPTITS